MKKSLATVIVVALFICGNSWGSDLLSRSVAIMTARKVTQALVLDGKLRDAGWKKATGGVLLPIRDKGKQTDLSRFLVSYDDKNIYIAAELYQSYLDPVYNMLSKTKVKCTKHDGGKFFTDDTFELFLQPQGSEDYYHIAFNMKGVVYDDKGSSVSSLSKKWTSSAKVAVHKDNTKWQLEIAIPLKTLGVTKPLTGQTWRVNFARGNAPKKEYYAWNPTLGPFHNPKRFGKLIFSDILPHIQTRAISNSRKMMTLTLRGGGKEKIVFKNSISKVEIPANKWKQIKIKAVPSQETGLTWISAFAGKQEIMRTPSLYIDNKLIKATALFQCENSKLTMFVNSRKMASASDAIKATIPLAANKNAIALEVNGTGTALTGSIVVNGLSIAPKQMLFNPTLAENWKSMDFNDSNWERYKGQPINGKAFFRYTLLKDYTLFAPQLNNNTFYLANGTSMFMRTRIGSPFAWALKDYTVTVKLPSNIDIPLYDQASRSYKRHSCVMKKKSLDKGNVYQFVFDNPMPKLKYNFGFNVLLFVVQSKLQGDKSESLKGEIFTQGYGVSEIPRVFTIQALPELKGKQPKKIAIIMANGTIGKSYSVNEMRALIPTLKPMGCNQKLILVASSADELKMIRDLKRYGVKSHLLYHGRADEIVKETWEKYPNKRFVNNRYPKKWGYWLCPLALMKDPLVIKNLSARFKILDIFCDDMERGYEKTCLCERCRQLFAAENNLNRVPSEDEIYKKYLKELAKFQIGMNKRCFEFYRKLAKKVNPKMQTSVYSGYDTPSNRSRYGIAWELYKDVDYTMAGYSINPDIINKTRKTLEGRSMVCGFILDSGMYKRHYANQNIKAVLFHQLVNSGLGGILVWTITELDGRAYTAIGEFSRGVATFEDFLNEKNEISSTGLVKGITPNAVHLYKKDGEYVLLVINTTNSDIKNLTIKLPQGVNNAKVFDFYNNKTVTVNKQFTTKIKANDALIFKITNK